MCSLNKPTPNIHQSAIWVELTGSPNWLARITVIAAASATEKALTWFNFVISPPTVAISLLQNIINPNDNPAAPRNIIQNGIETLSVVSPADWIVSLIATSGQIAFATSLAPWANDKRATAQIRGRLNNLLMFFLLFCNNDLCFLRYILVKIMVEIQTTTHKNSAVVGVTIVESHSEDFTSGFNHLSSKYIENTVAINQT